MRLLLALFALLAVPAVAAPVGEAHRTVQLPSAAARRSDHKPELPVTIWYPAVAGTIERPQWIGPPKAPLFRIADYAPDATPARGRHAVVLLSHGYGGSAASIGWLGVALARAGYVAIAVDHPGNNEDDQTDVGSIAWWERPRDLIAAFAAIRQDPRFAPLIDARRVGVGGFSMGGMTALAIGGARVEPKQYDSYCASHATMPLCLPPPERPDQPSFSRAEGIRLLGLTDAEAHAGEGTALSGVRAVLSIAPNVQVLAPESLGTIRVPTTLVVGSVDPVVPAADHAGLAAARIRQSRLVVVPGAAHYSFLAECTDRGRAVIGVCKMAPVQDLAHRTAIAEALALFNRTLRRR